MYQQLRWDLIGLAASNSKKQNCEISAHILTECDAYLCKAFSFDYILNFTLVSHSIDFRLFFFNFIFLDLYQNKYCFKVTRCIL